MELETKASKVRGDEPRRARQRRERTLVARASKMRRAILGGVFARRNAHGGTRGKPATSAPTRPAPPAEQSPASSSCDTAGSEDGTRAERADSAEEEEAVELPPIVRPEPGARTEPASAPAQGRLRKGEGEEATQAVEEFVNKVVDEAKEERQRRKEEGERNKEQWRERCPKPAWAMTEEEAQEEEEREADALVAFADSLEVERHIEEADKLTQDQLQEVVDSIVDGELARGVEAPANTEESHESGEHHHESRDSWKRRFTRAVNAFMERYRGGHHAATDNDSSRSAREVDNGRELLESNPELKRVHSFASAGALMRQVCQS